MSYPLTASCSGCGRSLPPGEAHRCAFVYVREDDQLPALGATENEAAPVVRVKLFTPDSSWTWYLLEYDPATDEAFGLVVGQETELGYFSLQELRDARGRLGLRIERDLYWAPRPIKEVRADEERRRG